MMRKYRKYKLLKNDYVERDGEKAYRIQAVRTNSKSGIVKGELGGYVSSENVIPQDPYDKSWVGGNSVVINSKLHDSKIYDNCIIKYSRINDSTIRGNSAIIKSVVSDTNAYGNNDIYNSVVHSCTMSGCSSFSDSCVSGITALSNAKIKDADNICDLQIGEGAYISSASDFSRIVFNDVLGYGKLYVTMYQYYNTGETVLQFDEEYNHLVTFDTLQNYFNKECSENDDEWYTKEAAEFVNDIRESIEVFEANLIKSKIIQKEREEESGIISCDQ